MSYGLNVPALFQRAAELLDKILRGTKPADIPVEQPTTFRLVVNLKTAKALGLAHERRIRTNLAKLKEMLAKDPELARRTHAALAGRIPAPDLEG